MSSVCNGGAESLWESSTSSRACSRWVWRTTSLQQDKYHQEVFFFLTVCKCTFCWILALFSEGMQPRQVSWFKRFVRIVFSKWVIFRYFFLLFFLFLSEWARVGGSARASVTLWRAGCWWLHVVAHGSHLHPFELISTSYGVCVGSVCLCWSVSLLYGGRHWHSGHRPTRAERGVFLGGGGGGARFTSFECASSWRHVLIFLLNMC